MAEQLQLSERTIKGYVSQLLLIFNAVNRTELVGMLAAQSPALEALRPACKIPERRVPEQTVPLDVDTNERTIYTTNRQL